MNFLNESIIKRRICFFYFLIFYILFIIIFIIIIFYRYCPVIPTVLVNGAEGIGTAWSTKIPNYNPREIAENIRQMIRGGEPKPLVYNFFLIYLQLYIF